MSSLQESDGLFFPFPLTTRFTLRFSISFAAKAFQLGCEVKILLSGVYFQQTHRPHLRIFLIVCISQYKIPQNQSTFKESDGAE